MTKGESNYLLRLEIELEGLKLVKHSGYIPRSKQEANHAENQNKRADRKAWLIKEINIIKNGNK